MARLGLVQLTGTILVTEWQSVGPLPLHTVRVMGVFSRSVVVKPLGWLELTTFPFQVHTHRVAPPRDWSLMVTDRPIWAGSGVHRKSATRAFGSAGAATVVGTTVAAGTVLEDAVEVAVVATLVVGVEVARVDAVEVSVRGVLVAAVTADWSI